MTNVLQLRPPTGVRRALLALAAVAAVALVAAVADAARQAGAPATGIGAPPALSPALASVVAAHPARPVEVIVQFEPGTDAGRARELFRAAGGTVTAQAGLIRGLAGTLPAAAAAELARHPAVRAVSPNAPVRASGLDGGALATVFNSVIASVRAWEQGATGDGVGVAVVDTGIAGDLPDFRRSARDRSSRVIVSAVVHPGAQTAGDAHGHGTHVAGLIAGDARGSGGRYAGVAPDANLISVKVADEEGRTTVLDVILGLQFVVDHQHDYGIRVVNLSLTSDVAESYRTDPLAAAVEQAWLRGLVVVAAAGNRGTAADAVSYAPGNDPYAITVGAIDDRGTARRGDDAVASWSSRGVTQDGVAKPDLLAPGASLVSTFAPGSAFGELCAACVLDGRWFRAGGTSMAAAVVSGAAALLLERHPEWTPDQVKGALTNNVRGMRGGRVVAVDKALRAHGRRLAANEALTPSDWVDPQTGRFREGSPVASWSASWSRATGSLQASWSAASWSCACGGGERDANPAASWSASWSGSPGW